MKWEGLNLHIENFIPGIVTLALILSFLPKTILDTAKASAVSGFLGDSFFLGAVFIAASYLVGIFSTAICQCIIDPISGVWPRPFMFRLFCRASFKNKTNSEINQAYRDATQRGLDSVSEYKRTEMKNRRERGRLLRSGILPLVLFLWWVAGDLNILGKIILLFIEIGICTFLYAYAQLSIYQESIVG